MGIKFVVLVVIVLAVIAIAQIMRVHELSAKVRGKREEDVDLRMNNLNASLMIVFLFVFFGSFIWMFAIYGNGLLPEPASVLGEEIHWLFKLNWILVLAIFFLTNGLLFFFAWKYRYHPDRKAHWFPHDNKLEMIWTVVPASTLAVIIILGLMTWNDITGTPSDDAILVEIYGKQFAWTVRYSGDDNKLGYADYKLTGESKHKISETETESYMNDLGVVTNNSILWKVQGLNYDINKLNEIILDDSVGSSVISTANLQKNIAKVEKLERVREHVLDMVGRYGDSVTKFAEDDFITKELVMVKDQEYFFVLRSEDVLHSAYFPHFRAQMNCVPGQRTSLKITPTKTTEEMRLDQNDPNFNFILLCNKICGVSHSNMNMIVRVVETQKEFDEWKNGDGNTYAVLDESKKAPSEIDMEPMVMPAVSNHGGEHADSHEENDHAETPEGH